MRYPKQNKTCECCEGYKRVAIITKGPRLFGEIIGKPLPMTFAKARETFGNYKGTDAGALTMLVRQLGQNLETRPCPWCKATGISYSIQQLTPEEAAVSRAQEEKTGS